MRLESNERRCNNRLEHTHTKRKRWGEVNKLIQRFIMWYLRKNNVIFQNGIYTVRMFTTNYYNNVMEVYKEWFERLKENDKQ